MQIFRVSLHDDNVLIDLYAGTCSVHAHVMTQCVNGIDETPRDAKSITALTASSIFPIPMTIAWNTTEREHGNDEIQMLSGTDLHAEKGKGMQQDFAISVIFGYLPHGKVTGIIRESKSENKSYWRDWGWK